VVGAERPDRVLIAVLAGNRESRRIGHCGVDDGAHRGPRIFVEGKDRAEIGLDRARQGEPVRLGAGVGSLVRQNATTERFQLDDSEDAQPGSRGGGNRIHELVTVDVQARSWFALQDALTQPRVEEPRRPGVLVVFRAVGWSDLAGD